MARRFADIAIKQTTGTPGDAFARALTAPATTVKPTTKTTA
jgi:hypothetical protein